LDISKNGGTLEWILQVGDTKMDMMDVLLQFGYTSEWRHLIMEVTQFGCLATRFEVRSGRNLVKCRRYLDTYSHKG
jgi:hypothetical protein